jgi:hypothetical protein
MTTLKTIYDYRQHSEPEELMDWIDKQAALKENSPMYDMKILYIIKPHADKMVKFGIAGHKEGGISALGRMRQYVNQHGIQNDLNQCLGVSLLYMVGHKYNKNVEPKNSFVHKKEQYIIKHFKLVKNDPAYKGRGKERVFENNLTKLIELINDTSNKSWDDVETARRKSEKIIQSKIQVTDKIEKITDHYTQKTGTSKTLYRVIWNRPYVLDENEQTANGITTKTNTVYGTDQKAKDFIDIKGGKTALKKYQKEHPNATFRD